MALFFFLLLLYYVLFSRCFFLVGLPRRLVQRPSVHLFRGALYGYTIRGSTNTFFTPFPGRIYLLCH